MGGQTENRPSLISIFQNSFRLKADHHTDVIIDGSCAFEELTATAGETTYRVKKNGEDTGYTVTFRQDETDSSKYHVVIDGLDEMNLNSTAITYYLEKQPDDDTISVGTTTYRKDDTAPAGQKRYRIEEDGIDTGKVVTFTETESGYDVSITQNGVTTPVYGAEKTQLMDVLINRNIPIADSTDTYRMQFKNDGINATVTNRIFQGGSASLVLTGAEEYETTIQWIDSQPTSDFRRDAVNSFNAGSFAIWRYVDKPGDNNKYEKVAFFGTAIIVPDENNDPDKAAISYVELVETDDGNGGTVTQARPVSIPKYDLDGNPYVYYVKGAPVIGNLQYETNLLINGFTDPNAQANIPDAIANGSTLTSKLTGDILFPITAGWVAAARQSGTASIAFEVQKNMGTAEEPDWQRVDIPSTDDQGNPITLQQLVFDGYSPEVMSQESNILLPGMKYNDTGDLNQFRLVQTTVTRNDGSGTITHTPNAPVYYDSQNKTYYVFQTVEGEVTRVDLNPAAVNSSVLGTVSFPNADGGTDRYHLLVRADENGQLHFTYSLVIKKKISIKIRWPFANPEWTQSDEVQNGTSIPVNLQYFDFEEGIFRPYTGALVDISDPEHPQRLQNQGGTFSIVYNGNGTGDPTSEMGYGDFEECMVTFEVSKYDSGGHENVFSVTELNTHGCMPIYYSQTDKTSGSPTFGDTDYYIDNPVGGEGQSIYFRKIWLDDGEIQYHRNIRIYMKKTGVYDEISENNGAIAEAPWNDYKYSDVELNNYNLLYDRVSLNTSYNTFNANDFMERISGNRINQFWTADQYGAADWIQLLQSEKYNNEIYENGQLRPGVRVADLISKNNVLFDPATFRGIYQTENHYYAVEYVPDNDNPLPNCIDIHNVRIGVVNYKLNLEWKVGNKLTDADGISAVEVTIRNTTDDPFTAEEMESYRSIIGLDDTYLASINMTPAQLQADSDSYTADQKAAREKYRDYQNHIIRQTLDVRGGVSTYYLMNLPKYNKVGKVINYTVDQVKLSYGSQIIEANNNQFRLDDNTICTVTRSEQEYHKFYDSSAANRWNSNTDDLIELTLTDQLVGTTTFPINA